MLDKAAATAGPQTSRYQFLKRYLKHGGDSLQHFWIGVLVVSVAHQQAAQPLPEVRQQLLEDAFVFGSVSAVQSRLVLPGNQHLRDQEEQRTVLEGRTAQRLLQEGEELQTEQGI